MLKFYFSGAPNPTKVALFLEEAGLPYEAIPVDTRKGEQHKPEYLKINPNAKVPAIVDGDATVFDSSAILLYLGEKTGKFMPREMAARRSCDGTSSSAIVTRPAYPVLLQCAQPGPAEAGTTGRRCAAPRRRASASE